MRGGGLNNLSRALKSGGLLVKNTEKGWVCAHTKGERRAQRYKLEKLKIERQKKWDGKWRVVMFDIPEEKRWRGER